VTEKEYFASSEKGVVPARLHMIVDPRPLVARREDGVVGAGVAQGDAIVYEHQEMQQRIFKLAAQRYDFRRLNELVMKAEIL
jgi:hypothetical protein